MSQDQDAQVIKSALGTHLTYLRAAEHGHRAAGRALSRHPELAHLADMQRSPIARAAAHRARGASFGQRAEFVEQLVDFPSAGLRSLTSGDMRTLQVPAHIGATAVPAHLAAAIAERESSARLAAARSGTRPAVSAAADPEQPTESPAGSQADREAPSVSAPPKRRLPWFRRSFEDILRGRK